MKTRTILKTMHGFALVISRIQVSITFLQQTHSFCSNYGFRIYQQFKLNHTFIIIEYHVFLKMVKFFFVMFLYLKVCSKNICVELSRILTKNGKLIR